MSLLDANLYEFPTDQFVRNLCPLDNQIKMTTFKLKTCQ